MIPTAFDYLRPTQLVDAVAALREAPDETAILAGGQTLLTELKLRRRRPRRVLDVSAVLGHAVDPGPDGLTIGGMARQTAVATETAGSPWSLLTQVAAEVGDPMVRGRGTLVGAFCAAEAGGDWTAAGLVLEAELELASERGTRRMGLRQLVAGPGPAALAADEIATAARLPKLPLETRSRYAKVRHPANGSSVVGAAIVVLPQAGRRAVRVAVSGATDHPQRLPSLEAALGDIAPSDERSLAAAIEAALTGLSFRGDSYASAGYRAGRLAVLLRRTLPDILNEVHP
jgi:aerobic carbon-monoxide dehydrogenase medium subunit